MDDFLKAMGVLFLICGLVGGVIIIHNYGVTILEIPGYFGSTQEKVTNWYAIIAGLAMILQGVFSFAVSFTLGNTSTRTSKILSKLELLEKKSKADTTEETEPPKVVKTPEIIEEEGKESWRKHVYY